MTEHVSCVFYVYVQHTVNLHDEFIFKPEKSKATDYTKNTLTARKQVTIVLLKEILQIHCLEDRLQLAPAPQLLVLQVLSPSTSRPETP